MLETPNIDEEIYNIDKIIFDSIELMAEYSRGFLSETILKSLRDLIEHIAIKILSISNGYELPLVHESTVKAVSNIYNIGQYSFLSRFHRFVQNAVGHRSPTYDNAERLMLKYYEYLLKLKTYCEDQFNMKIFNNINKFPLNTDKTYYQYYGKIAQKINEINISKEVKYISGRYYVQKSKPFFIDDKIYHEITLSPAVDNPSKFDRITMFTKCEIDTNYAIKVSIKKEKIEIFGVTNEIQIITNWQCSIRPCEITNFYKLFGQRIEYSANYKEYKLLMSILTTNKYSLLNFVNYDLEKYEELKQYFKDNCSTMHIINLMDMCRNIICNDLPGKNILKYLLYTMNNSVIKKQMQKDANFRLSNLYLSWGCIPFETMPLATSLIDHNPNSYDLYECFDCVERKDELLARYIRLNAEQNGVLYTPIKEVEFLGNVTELIKKYNSKLYLPKHQYRELIQNKNDIYLRGYEDDSLEIIRKLQNLTIDGIKWYDNKVDFWLKNSSYYIDDEEKKNILKNLFVNSKVAVIYGAAGTGKTTMINHISNFFNNDKKIYLANTHPAIENLKRKVSAQNSSFYTVKKMIYNKTIEKKCDILIIDECSTVSNKDMLKVLNSIEFDLLVLVGDVFQIESITFGNWFGIASNLLEENVKFELTVPYRSNNENLKKLWKKVRELDDEIVEWMSINRYCQKLDESILENNNSDDEIILCLNYDGLYGINNINRFMQNSNSNSPIYWGIGTYKVGDPILFNESNRFSPIVYNNLKGKIKAITVEEEKHRIWFDIEIDTVISERDADFVGLELLESTENNSTIRFFVNEFKDVDEEDDFMASDIVPFFVAYAVSIHKAQGLEYNSVKIIITQEIEENISHNVFYTAITRAMEHLKIYWTPECQNRIISNMHFKFNKRDAYIIKNKLNAN